MAPLRGASAVPAEGAAHRHRAGAGHARRVHRRRRGADLAVLLGLLHLRRVPDLHRDQPGPAGRAGRGRLHREPADPVEPQGAADLRGLRRREADHPRERQAAVHPDADRDDRDRHHRPDLRARLDPGDLRDHPGAVPGLHRQRLRADGAAPALLPARWPAGPADLPVLRPGRRARLHRRQAGAGGAGRQQPAVHQRRRARRLGPAHPDLAVAGW